MKSPALLPLFTRSKARPARQRAAEHAGDDYGATAQPDWRSVEWRRHMHWMDIGGAKMHYVDLGEEGAPAVVFVHGWGGSWQNWLETLPQVAGEHRVIALDLLGFGESDMPSGEYTISGLGRVVDELCERLELGHVALVGSSMGGFVSAEMAIAFPERVEALVLVSPAGISQGDMRQAPTAVAVRILVLGTTLLGAGSRNAALRPKLRHRVMASIFRHPSRIPLDLVFEQQAVGRPLTEGFLRALDAFTSYDFRDRLPEIRCRTLVVHGEQDLIVPVEDADEFERLIPDARKVVLEDTGHLPMMERPPTFNELLMRFLAGREEKRESLPDRGESATV